MDWTDGRSITFAYGAEHGYLVITGESEVRLTRFSVAVGAQGLTSVTAREAAESTIIFPLGRGPGRPGGEPELAALAEYAKTFAERFESGASLAGYPGWQHAADFPEPDPNAGRCPGPGGCFPGEACDYIDMCSP